MKPRQRSVLLEKMPDLANLAIGALLFGQFVGDQPFSLWLALAGAALWLAIMAVTFSLAGADDR